MAQLLCGAVVKALVIHDLPVASLSKRKDGPPSPLVTLHSASQSW